MGKPSVTFDVFAGPRGEQPKPKTVPLDELDDATLSMLANGDKDALAVLAARRRKRDGTSSKTSS